MRAFHTLRTKNRPDFRLDDFEILTLMLSALEWKKHNGGTILHTDSVGKRYLERLGILNIWDSVSTSLDEMDNLGLNEEVFWAGGKFFALIEQDFPCVMIDLDFIVWQPLDFERFQSEIAVIHCESTSAPCYPEAGYFHFVDGFILPEWLDWSLEPCNCALVYFGDREFVEAYCGFAFDFMRHAVPPTEQTGWDLLPYMVFIEQRWLSMCAEASGKKIHSLSSLPELFSGEQKFFTHLWGQKQVLRDNPLEAKKYCCNCAGRLAHDFC